IVSHLHPRSPCARLEIFHQHPLPRIPKKLPALSRTPHHLQKRRRANPPGRRPQSHRIPAQKIPPHPPQTHRRPHRSRHALLRARPLRRLRNVRGMGRSPRRRRHHRPRPRFQPHVHAHRQRRHRQSRRLLPHDRQESHPRAKHRHRQSHPHHLSRRFRRRLSPSPGRCFPRYRRFRTRLPQQRRHERPRHPTTHRHHGHVRSRRRLSPRHVRSHPHDRRLWPLPSRPCARASRHRSKILRRRIRWRQNARANQRHRGLPRTRRRI